VKGCRHSLQGGQQALIQLLKDLSQKGVLGQARRIFNSAAYQKEARALSLPLILHLLQFFLKIGNLGHWGRKKTTTKRKQPLESKEEDE